MIASGAIARVQSYIDGVLSGDIVTGKLVRSAVQRHVDDLGRQDSEGFPYWFDNNAAECAIDFFPICLRHSKGEFQGMPFELQPWQAAGVAMIHGWKRCVDDSRRFRRVYWSTGRKNGKSTWAAGEALLLATADINPKTSKPEAVGEIYLCGPQLHQIRRVMYREVLRMRQASPELRGISTTVNQMVRFPATDTTIECVGSDKEYSGLNPLLVLKDEIHEFHTAAHKEFLATMETGGGSRVQPLDIATTTAGANNSYIWLGIYKYFRAVALGEITDDTVFTWCFEIDERDDPFDKTNWVKANPNLGVSVKEAYLEEKLTEAKQDILKANEFTRYHCNRVTESTERAFDMAEWDACEGKLSDWSLADAVGAGVDLGGRDDLAAFALVARFEAGEQDGQPVWRYEARSWAFIAEDCERDLTKQPFAQWIYEDKLHCCQYPIATLQQQLIENCWKYQAQQIGYDPHQAQTMAEEITRTAGIPCGRMSQSCAFFNEPIRDLLNTIKLGLFRHNGDPVLRWSANNAVVATNWKKQWMFGKFDSADKIDPIVATTMAYRAAMLAPRRYRASGYQDGNQAEEPEAMTPQEAAEIHAQRVLADD